MAGASDTGLPTPQFDKPVRVLIVVSPYYEEVAEALLAGARAVLDAAGAEHETVSVPGALEIPTAIRMATESNRYDAYVALGCVIRGETSHYDIVAGESARGLAALGLAGHAVGNGILTVDRLEQAQRRAGSGDKGGDAARAALHLCALARRMRRPELKGVGFRPRSEEITIAGGTGRDIL